MKSEELNMQICDYNDKIKNKFINGNYIKAENIKFKRTVSNRLIWIAPFFTAFFALMAGGFTGFQYMAFYWWYSFFMSGTVAIICWLSIQKEVRAGKYFSVFSLPLDLVCFESTKSLVIAKKLIISAIFLAAFVSFNNMISPQTTVYYVWQSFGAGILIMLSGLWQIPLCLYLARKTTAAFAIVLNVSLSIFCNIMLTNSFVGWYFPYCWPPKMGEMLLGINMNGTFLGNVSFSYITIVLMVTSFILFWAMTMFDARDFAKQGGIR